MHYQKQTQGVLNEVERYHSNVDGCLLRRCAVHAWTQMERLVPKGQGLFTERIFLFHLKMFLFHCDPICWCNKHDWCCFAGNTAKNNFGGVARDINVRRLGDGKPIKNSGPGTPLVGLFHYPVWHFTVKMPSFTNFSEYLIWPYLVARAHWLVQNDNLWQLRSPVWVLMGSFGLLKNCWSSKTVNSHPTLSFSYQKKGFLGSMPT